MKVLGRVTVTELRLFLREPLAVFFAMVFPPLLLGILGSVPGFREHQAELGGTRMVDIYVPILISLSIATLALTGLPQLLATYRERGVLRRMATTPVRPTTMLGAQLVMCAGMALVTMAVMLAVGRIAFGVALPRQVAGYAVAYVLSVVAMLTVGLVVAALAPSGKGAGAIGTVLFFPVLFFAGLWVPRATMPEGLRRVSDFTPLGAGVQSLQDAAGGAWPHLAQVAVLLGWTVAAGAAAARFFRWE
jgi:ABC-2 type transport system permease protein